MDELLAGDITQNTVDILAQAGILGAAAEKLMASGDDSLAQEAHTVCPYSRATRGNITVNVSGRSR